MANTDEDARNALILVIVFVVASIVATVITLATVDRDEPAHSPTSYHEDEQCTPDPWSGCT